MRIFICFTIEYGGIVFMSCDVQCMYKRCWLQLAVIHGYEKLLSYDLLIYFYLQIQDLFSNVFTSFMEYVAIIISCW